MRKSPPALSIRPAASPSLIVEQNLEKMFGSELLVAAGQARGLSGLEESPHPLRIRFQYSFNLLTPVTALCDAAMDIARYASQNETALAILSWGAIPQGGCGQTPKRRPALVFGRDSKPAVFICDDPRLVPGARAARSRCGRRLREHTVRPPRLRYASAISGASPSTVRIAAIAVRVPAGIAAAKDGCGVSV